MTFWIQQFILYVIGWVLLIQLMQAGTALAAMVGTVLGVLLLGGVPFILLWVGLENLK